MSTFGPTSFSASAQNPAAASTGGPTQASLRLTRAYAAPDQATEAAVDARSADVVSLSSTVGMPAQARALVAARVQAAADPGSSTPAAESPMAFYRRPAERNVVATRIATGTSIDLRG